MFIESSTLEEKEKWKAQIFEAAQALHKREISWGDAPLGNIAIEDKSGRGILINFGGGHNGAHVDKKLKGAKAEDLTLLTPCMQGIKRMHQQAASSRRLQSFNNMTHSKAIFKRILSRRAAEERHFINRLKG